jgi:chromosome segregation ATPase
MKSIKQLQTEVQKFAAEKEKIAAALKDAWESFAVIEKDLADAKEEREKVLAHVAVHSVKEHALKKQQELNEAYQKKADEYELARAKIHGLEEAMAEAKEKLSKLDAELKAAKKQVYESEFEKLGREFNHLQDQALEVFRKLIILSGAIQAHSQGGRYPHKYDISIVRLTAFRVMEQWRYGLSEIDQPFLLRNITKEEKEALLGDAEKSIQ